MRPVRALVLVVIAVSALLTGCTPGGAPDPSPTPSPADEMAIGELGAPGCQPASPRLGDVVQGTGVGSTTASGLLEAAGAADLTVGEPLKLIVRMTGSGDLSAGLVAPDDSARELDWGPEPHSSSNFSGAGDEWGVGFTFDTPGCWAVNLRRAGGEQATFWLVAA